MDARALCRNCGYEVGADARTCPHCGVADPVPTPEEERRRVRWWLGEGMLAALILLGLLAALCWLGQRLCRILPALVRDFLR